MKNNKNALTNWRNHGRPAPPHHLGIARLETKKTLRRAMRETAADCQQTLYVEILQAAHGDPALFHKLIRRQHSTSSNPTGSKLLMNGSLVTDPDEILSHWTDHFRRLATPDTSQVSAHHRMVSDDIAVIKELCHRGNEAHQPVGRADVLEACSKLNSRKAVDSMGLASEHLKYAMEPLAPHLAEF